MKENCSNKPKLVEKKYLVSFILITSLFALWGFANDITNPMVSYYNITNNSTIVKDGENYIQPSMKLLLDEAIEKNNKKEKSGNHMVLTKRELDECITNAENMVEKMLSAIEIAKNTILKTED